MTKTQQLESQLEMAQHVQSALLPKSRATANLDLAVQSTPAGHVGGDVCDIFETDRGRAALVIGDVCGKGVAAALLMGVIYGAMRSSPWTASASDHELSIERLNDLLRRKTGPERFASLFTAYYEPETSRLRYINAGHQPLLLIRQPEAKFHVERLDQGGPILGIFDWGGYQQSSVPIAEGDQLVLFSDGILEAMNAAGEPFGESRIIDVMREHCAKTPAEIRDVVMSAVHSHTGNREPADDQTLVIARFQNVCPSGVLTSMRTFSLEELMS